MRVRGFTSGSRDPLTDGLFPTVDAVLQTPTKAGDIGSMVIAAGLLVLLGLGGVALWRTKLEGLLDRTGERRRGADGDTSRGELSSADRTQSPETADQPTVEADHMTGEQTQTPAERSDAEFIVEILEANGGRMRQAAIVEETEWSKSKVSMVLSEMEDNDEISKLRVGRENIVSLSGNEPDAAGSPFDDE